MVGTGGTGVRNVWCLNVERVLPLRLRGRALSVYRRLTCDQREDLQQVKQALLVAFAPDPFVAFDTFVSRRLHSGETVDEYLGDLLDLARLIEENTSDRWLSCAFVSGLPGPVRRQLCGSSRMVHECLGYRSEERITISIGEEGTKSQTCLVSSRDGSYFHYAANWLGTFPWVVGIVTMFLSTPWLKRF